MPDEIRIIGDLERLVLKPGDMFVLTIPHYVSREDFERVKQALEQHFPEHKVMVLTEGAKLNIVGKN